MWRHRRKAIRTISVDQRRIRMVQWDVSQFTTSITSVSQPVRRDTIQR